MPGNNENKLDRFFRTKAEDVNLLPSPLAWGKIESQLVKKNKVVFAYRLAAGIVLAGILTIILVDVTRERTKEITAAPVTTKKTEVPTIARVDERTPPESAKAAPRKKRKTVTMEATIESAPEILQSAPEQTLVEAIPEVSVAVETPKIVKQEKSIVLVYSLPALPKKAPDASFPAEEKMTGIQKVMEVAKDVKNSDNPIGELREAKNELFALEFRRDKDKSKNQ